MAVTRLSLSNILEDIRLDIGEPTAATSKVTDAQIVRNVNVWQQGLAVMPAPKHFPMWREASTLSCSAGSSTVYLPIDTCDPISFYDTSNDRMLDIVTNVKLFHPDLVERTPSAPQAIELLDWALDGSSVWRPVARLWPATPAGVTPTVDIDYWRYPAAFPNSSPTTEYVDCDIKFQLLWRYGPGLMLMAPDDPGFDYIKRLYDELLGRLLATAV